MKFDFWKTQREDTKNEKYLDLIINRDYSNPLKPVVRMFRGRQSRPFYNCYLPSIEQAENRIQKEKENSLAKHNRIETEKQDKKEALSNFKSSLSEGTILTCSWGYDQTNVEFYEVLSVSGKTVTIQEIGQDYSETGFMCGQTKPDRSKKIGNPLKKKICVRVYDGKVNESVKINESVRLHVWDGRLCYSSSYA